MKHEEKTTEQLINQLKGLGNRKTKKNEYGPKQYKLSLIKWGIVRRMLLKIFGKSPYQFTPAYELAIYEEKDGEIGLRDPCFVFHYANKDLAVSRMKWMEKLLRKEGGMRELILSLRNLDAKQEAIFSDYGDYFEKEMECF